MQVELITRSTTLVGSIEPYKNHEFLFPSISIDYDNKSARRTLILGSRKTIWLCSVRKQEIVTTTILTAEANIGKVGISKTLNE